MPVRIEHFYTAVAQLGGKVLSTIGDEDADFGMTVKALLYNIKRLTYLKTAGIEVFSPQILAQRAIALTFQRSRQV